MSVLLDGSTTRRASVLHGAAPGGPVQPVETVETQERPRTHRPVRARRPAGETRRPPTRARVVAGRGRPGAADCGPRHVLPRWPWLAAVAVVAALVITGLGVFAGEMSPPIPSRTATVTVGDGQTLWDVARQYAPSSDADDVVARIEQLNNLQGDTVFAGLPLTVPVDSAPPAAGQ